VPYDIYRVAKLKSHAAIAGATAHVERRRPTPNADPDRRNYRLIGPEDTHAEIRRRLAGVKARKDSVLAMEVLLSASPSYFRPRDPSAAGRWDRDRLQAWVKQVTGWLRQEFGDNLVSAHLHLDEATPHIQAFVVPLREGRLSAKTLFTPQTLREQQDRLNLWTGQLGLSRGIKGSQAKHQDVARWYGAMHRPAPDPKLPPVEVPPVMLREGTRRAWAERQTRERGRATRRLVEQLHSKAAAAQTLQHEVTGYRLTAEKASREREEAQAALREERKRAADEVRRIPLEEVLPRLGFARLKSDRSKWTNGHETVTISSAKPGKFFVQGLDKGGGGAIDLVMMLQGVKFDEAVAWLGGNLPGEVVAREASKHAAEAARSRAEQVLARRPLVMPKPDAWALAGPVRRYLHEVRGLSLELIDRLIRQGRIYADRLRNAVFVMGSPERPEGAELRGTGEVPFRGCCAGTTRDGEGFTVTHGRGETLVLVESAIDALSFYELHAPKGWGGPGGFTVRSTAGVRSQAPYITAPPSGRSLVVAFDADEAGDQHAAAIISRIPGAVRLRPTHGKDWNDELKWERERELNGTPDPTPPPSPRPR